MTDVDAQSLRGSRASIDRMYRQAQANDLTFYETARGVRSALDAGRLVTLTGNADYRLKDVSQPYVLPATRTFVERLAAQYHNWCGEKLVITSGTRPQSMRLANSSRKTVHPTGMAVDLRRPTASRCVAWMRNTLSSLEEEGILEAIEERNPAHFHVAVFPDRYKRYVSRNGGTVRLASASVDAPVRRASAPSSGSASTYKVRRGDSLWTIARRMNVSVEALRRANALHSSNIVAGQLLTIPSGN